MAPTTGGEWVELYNPTASAVDVGGFYVDDVAGGGGAPQAIPAGTVIPAGGRWVFEFASGFPNTTGPESVRFLSGSGASELVHDSFSWSLGSTQQDKVFHRVGDARRVVHDDRGRDDHAQPAAATVELYGAPGGSAVVGRVADGTLVRVRRIDGSWLEVSTAEGAGRRLGRRLPPVRRGAPRGPVALLPDAPRRPRGGAGAAGRGGVGARRPGAGRGGHRPGAAGVGAAPRRQGARAAGGVLRRRAGERPAALRVRGGRRAPRRPGRTSARRAPAPPPRSPARGSRGCS